MADVGSQLHAEYVGFLSLYARPARKMLSMVEKMLSEGFIIFKQN